MPVIKLELVKMSKETKSKLVKEVTEVVARNTGLPAQSFYVFITENESDNVGIGGTLLSDLNTSDK